MEWAHCKRKHEVKMTEMHELNRPVICLRYAARGVGIRGVAHSVKPANGFRLPIPSASAAQTINWASRVRSDSQLASYPIHFLNRIGRRRKPSGASYTTKSSWKEPPRLNNYIVGSVGWPTPSYKFIVYRGRPWRQVFRYPEHPRFSDGVPDSPAQ